jgi:proline iminopeptidase
MRLSLIAASLVGTLATTMPLHVAGAQHASESRIAVGSGVSLYVRTIGKGQPVIVLHGGPDFDHAYLLPDLDRLADTVRLIYYDQRGRGLSAEGVQPEDVTLVSEVEDLDVVREHFGQDKAVLLGHSWGAVLALEYALRHPSHVSRLVLMNPAPASTSDVVLLRNAYLEKLGAAMAEQRAIVAGEAYQSGDPEAVAARYRIHFTPALVRREHYEQLMATMKTQFIKQGKEGIVKARAVEDQLMRDSWQLPDYDLLPKLRSLHVPTTSLAHASQMPVEPVGYIRGDPVGRHGEVAGVVGDLRLAVGRCSQQIKHALLRLLVRVDVVVPTAQHHDRNRDARRVVDEIDHRMERAVKPGAA